MEKIKCYTMSQGTSKFIAKELNEILEYLKVEIEENLEDDEKINFDFGIEYMTQDEFDNLSEFDGF